MKKLLFFIFLSVMCIMMSCNPEGQNRNKSRILVYALCKMDIKSGQKPRKDAGLDIEGDSIAVHKLARWAILMTGHFYKGMPYFDTIWNPTREFQSPILTWDNICFSRDTLNHVFTFSNDAVIEWREKEVIDGEMVGIDGFEYLGWLASFEDCVFVSYCDSTRTVCYDPLTSSFDWPQERDTLGYIPSRMLKENREHLMSLLAEKRYQDMIDFFKSGAYTIYTCTGEEYRELVRQGLN
ncbi:MAG: hypothetical protein NC396_03350 [Bacteroides sp.]|nr:hypothetical protein [Bacteroides sp.]MCM1085131.1 hypothetical protein [Bacteroides sp.]